MRVAEVAGGRSQGCWRSISDLPPPLSPHLRLFLRRPNTPRSWLQQQLTRRGRGGCSKQAGELGRDSSQSVMHDPILRKARNNGKRARDIFLEVFFSSPHSTKSSEFHSDDAPVEATFMHFYAAHVTGSQYLKHIAVPCLSVFWVPKV